MSRRILALLFFCGAGFILTGAAPARVAADLIDSHVKESGASNTPGGGGPPNRALYRVSALYCDLDE
jgi:hypothetical protein